MPNEKIRAIIFDMGGVIILTCDNSKRIALAEQLGTSIEKLSNLVFSSDSAIRCEEGEISKNDHWNNILRILGKDPVDDATSYDEAFWSGDCIDKGLIELISSLKKKYRIGLLSNAFKGAREFVNNQFHFLDIFDITIFSYEVKLRKPDVRIYQLACERLDVSPGEALFIDDMAVNVEGARQAGLKAIQYINNTQIKIQLSDILGIKINN
jgi:epoxide hydrolase-like predicted phosphatase